MLAAGRILPAHFIHDFADVRIRLLPRVPFRPNADFGTTVAAEHRTILHQRDSQPVSRRRKRRTCAGDTAADHDEIKFAAVFRFLR